MDKIQEVIRKTADKQEWCVFSEDGDKNLGCFDSLEKAKNRLRQVEFFKRVKENDALLQEQEKTRRKWSKDSAAKWLKAHDFKTGNVEKQANFWSFRQTDPAQYDTFRTSFEELGFKPEDGVAVVFGIKTANGKRTSKIQTIRFYHGEAQKVNESFDFELLEAKDDTCKVRIISGGTSLNKTHYTDSALKDIVNIINTAQKEGRPIKCNGFFLEKWLNHLPEKARSFAKGFAGNVAGWFRDAYIKGKDVLASLDISGSAEWLKKSLHTAFDKKIAKPFGLSIDGDGELEEDMIDGEYVKRVDSVRTLNSVDVVTNPSANGGFLAFAESYFIDSFNKEQVMYDYILREIGKKFPELVEGIEKPDLDKTKEVLAKAAEQDERYKFELTEADSGEIYMSLIKIREEDEKKELDELKKKFEEEQEKLNLAESKLKEAEEKDKEKDKKDKGGEDNMDAVKKLEEKIKEMEAKAEAKEKKREWVEKLTSIVAESELDETQKSLIVELFENKVDEEEGLRAKINSLAKKAQDALDKDTEDPKVKVVKEQRSKAIDALQADMDKFCGVRDKDGNLAEGSGSVSGIKELYVKITGDKDVTGKIQPNHRPANALMEAIITSDFSTMLGTSANKRMINEYDISDKSYQKIAQIVPISDFKQQDRISYGEYANLSTVAESATYTEFATPTEETANYSPTKRGNFISISMEAIKNDDLRRFGKTARDIGRAAARTLNQFAFDLLLSYTSAINDTNIYDGNVLYDATNHSNTATDALSVSTFRTGRNAMWNQKDLDDKLELGIEVKYLIVPKALESTARVIVESEFLPSSANNDINTEKGMAEVLVSKYLRSDANNWYLLGDPKQWDTIELGFVDGKEKPELFKQSNETVGTVWTHDRISWKVRHSYGGIVTDYRPFYGGIVA